jgi:hypothetical protein
MNYTAIEKVNMKQHTKQDWRNIEVIYIPPRRPKEVKATSIPEREPLPASEVVRKSERPKTMPPIRK